MGDVLQRIPPAPNWMGWACGVSALLAIPSYVLSAASSMGFVNSIDDWYSGLPVFGAEWFQHLCALSAIVCLFALLAMRLWGSKQPVDRTTISNSDRVGNDPIPDPAKQESERLETVRKKLTDLFERIPTPKNMSPLAELMVSHSKAMNSFSLSVSQETDWRVELKEYVSGSLKSSHAQALNFRLKHDKPEIATSAWLQGVIDNLSEKDLK